MRRWLILAVASMLPLAFAPSAHAFEQPATGKFTIKTAPGVFPAWTSAGITVTGIAPATVTISRLATDASISLPVVARAQTANATAGGFRIVNTRTNAAVRCEIPTVDTRARVVDCLLPAGYNMAIFSIENIETRSTFTSSTTRTTIVQGMDMKLTAAGALLLNRELGTTVFTTSVRAAIGDFSVTRKR